MGFRTRNVPGGSTANRLPLLAAVLGIVALAALAFFGVRALVGQPTPEEVVRQFEEQGLDVGESYPIEQDPGWEESPTPKVHEDGVRFLIPSVCPKECGGRVFSFEEKEDLEVMEGYYESLGNIEIFGPNFGGYTYRNGLLLLQIGFDAKKSKADEYGRVFEEM